MHFEKKWEQTADLGHRRPIHGMNGPSRPWAPISESGHCS